MDDFEEFIDETEEHFQILADEPELIAQSSHKSAGHFFLKLRNIFVIAALVLFIASLFAGEYTGIVRGTGYFLGAGAYIAELFMLTDCFTRDMPHSELFMVYCFGPLYILMGIIYLIEG